MVETHITEVVITPRNSDSDAMGMTDMVYTLRLSPMKMAYTEARTHPLSFCTK